MSGTAGTQERTDGIDFEQVAKGFEELEGIWMNIEKAVDNNDYAELVGYIVALATKAKDLTSVLSPELAAIIVQSISPVAPVVDELSKLAVKVYGYVLNAKAEAVTANFEVIKKYEEAKVRVLKAKKEILVEQLNITPELAVQLIIGEMHKPLRATLGFNVNLPGLNVGEGFSIPDDEDCLWKGL